MRAGFSPPGFYPILNVRSEEAGELDRVRRLAAALLHGGVTLAQLRAKTLPAGALTDLALELTSLLRAGGCPLLVNDRVDVALASGAAGVHVGDEDLPVGIARRLLGREAIVGYSTHSIAEVRNVPREASYLAFGPIFESPTKAGVTEPRGIEQLREVCRISPLPVVAIGGITRERAPSVWQAGAASCAVISDIASASDPAASARAWLALYARTHS